jgi:hydrogenase-4 component F
VLAHGVGKTVLFLAGGQLQAAHGTTAIGEITAVLSRSRLVGGAFAVGMVVLLGLPPFAMFASELAIAMSLADAQLAWALALALTALLVAFAALTANSGRMLLGAASAEGPQILVPATVAAALVAGVLVSVALGITAGPLAGLFTTAATQLGAL